MNERYIDADLRKIRSPGDLWKAKGQYWCYCFDGTVWAFNTLVQALSRLQLSRDNAEFWKDWDLKQLNKKGGSTYSY